MAKKKILIVEDQFVEAYDLQLILENAGYEVVGIASDTKEAIQLVTEKKPDLVCLDIFLHGKETGIDLAVKLRESHIGFIYISANSGKNILDRAKETQPYGFIVKPFREKDVLTTLEIACYRHTHSLEFVLRQIGFLQESVETALKNAKNREEATLHLGKTLQQFIPFDYMTFGKIGEMGQETVSLLHGNFEKYQIVPPSSFTTDHETTIPQWKEPSIIENGTFAGTCKDFAPVRMVAESFGMRALLAVPISLTHGDIYHFLFYSRQSDAYTNEHLFLVSGILGTLAKFAEKVRTFPTSKQKPKKTDEPQPETTTSHFEGMIGSSKKMITVFNYIKKVAPSDTSVLILGESGTGKEKVAKCIHDLSPRKNHPFVVINCGAIPEKLAESVLFGHEKGAFTGADDKHIGKFELADKGTIFLDEIGEMPIDLQVKLLRVLQEMEIERVGGKLPIKIDTRVIAATNKNLEEEVAAGRFRMDLYYRLYIFPITVPALRERKDDIAALADHFIDLYCSKMGREKLSISEEIHQEIVSYQWPGNIRQLEHLIQRSILLTEGNTITEIDIPASQNYDPEPEMPFGIKTIVENERDYISAILKKCKGKIYGSGGAAELLNIPPSTLNSKIKKLGIQLKAF